MQLLLKPYIVVHCCTQIKQSFKALEMVVVVFLEILISEKATLATGACFQSTC